MWNSDLPNEIFLAPEMNEIAGYRVCHPTISLQGSERHDIYNPEPTFGNMMEYPYSVSFLCTIND